MKVFSAFSIPRQIPHESISRTSHIALHPVQPDVPHQLAEMSRSVLVFENGPRRNGVGQRTRTRQLGDQWRQGTPPLRHYINQGNHIFIIFFAVYLQVLGPFATRGTFPETSGRICRASFQPRPAAGTDRPEAAAATATTSETIIGSVIFSVILKTILCGILDSLQIFVCIEFNRVWN